MGKPLRILLAGLGLLVLLAVLVAVAVVLLVDPDEYRGVIADAVESRTGRQLNIDGSLSLDLFPCCGFAVGRMALSNPPGFPEGPFARLESARLGIRLWPLLTRRQILLGEIRVDGLELNLLARADGTDNWTFSSSDSAPAAGTTPASPAPELTVEGIRLRDATITWTDEAAGSRWRVEGLELLTGAYRGAATPVPIEARARFMDLTDELTGRLETRGSLTADLDGGRYAFSDLVTSLEVFGRALPASQAGADLRAGEAVLITGAVPRAELRGAILDLDLRGVRELGDLAGKLSLPAADVAFGETTTVSVPAMNADLRLSQPVAEVLKGQTIPLTGSLKNLTLDADSFSGTVSELVAAVDVAGAKLALQGQGRFGERNSLSGRLTLEPFAPRELLKRLNQEVPTTADPAVLGRFAGGGAWYLGDDRAGLEDADFTLDDTRFTGRLSAGLGDDPEIRFDLNVDRLNLDRYLEPKAAGSGGGGGAAGPVELPVETIRDLNLNGQARFGELIVAGLRLAEVSVGVAARGGQLRLEPLNTRLYGGQYTGRIAVDARGPQARVTLNTDLNGVELGGLLADFTDVKNLRGRLVTRLSGTATGNTDEALIRSLAGDVALNLADGVYSGVDLWYEIYRARALLRRDPPPGRSGPVETPIKALELTGRITEGVLKSDRFVAEIPFVNLTGDLGLDLPAKTLDSKFMAQIYQAPELPDGSVLRDLAGVRIPLTVAGPLDAPKVRVDMGGMVSGAVRDTVRDVLRDSSSRLLDRLNRGSAPAETAPATPAEGQQPLTDGATPAEPPAEQKKEEDPLKRALDRLIRR